MCVIRLKIFKKDIMDLFIIPLDFKRFNVSVKYLTIEILFVFLVTYFRKNISLRKIQLKSVFFTINFLNVYV